MSFKLSNNSALITVWYLLQKKEKRLNDSCFGFLKYRPCRKKWGFKSLMRRVQWWQPGTWGQIINWALSDRCVKCNWHGPGRANITHGVKTLIHVMWRDTWHHVFPGQFQLRLWPQPRVWSERPQLSGGGRGDQQVVQGAAEGRWGYREAKTFVKTQQPTQARF